MKKITGMKGDTMRVLLVDDHPLVLSGMKALIESLEPAARVMQANSAAAARRLLEHEADHDLVLLDLQLGDADGFVLLAELRELYPALPVVVISGASNNQDVIRCIDLGAMGYVSKRASTEELTAALLLVMSGGIYVPPMATESATAGAAVSLGVTANGEAQQAQVSLAELGLTPRQTDVLTLLLQGKPNKVIARELSLSVETIKDHVAAVLRALGVNTRTQAVLAVGQMSVQGGYLPGWRRPQRASPAAAANPAK